METNTDKPRPAPVTYVMMRDTYARKLALWREGKGPHPASWTTYDRWCFWHTAFSKPLP